MSKVIIKDCIDYNLLSVIDKINSGMNLLGGWEQFIKPGMKVLLKVNLIGPKASDSAAITHSEFVRAITRILKHKGCIVWIGDSSGGAIAGIAPTAQSFIISGLQKVADEEGAIIMNFDREGVVEVTPPSNSESKMYLAKPMFTADFVINLPKLKTHTAGIYTGAVKNLFGCIPGLKKAQYHKDSPSPKDFGEILTDINMTTKVGLHIMDAITSMEGEGPTAGEIYNSGKILISKDPLALDTVAAAMIGIDVSDLPILYSACYRNLGEYKLYNIKILGDYSKIIKLTNFRLPKNFGVVKKNNGKALSRIITILKSKPSINLKKCKKCNLCVESCPVHVIDKDSKKINYSKCIECMCCHELCTYKAVELKRVNPFVGFLMKFYNGPYK